MIKSIYHEHKGRYGYRRIHLELKKRGFMLNHKTLQRLMGQINLKSMVRIKEYRSYRGESGRTTPNILERDFSASHSDEKWVTAWIMLLQIIFCFTQNRDVSQPEL
ncbi:IS3 family transposase [Vibrio sp. B1REV9]|uniref:IS3 family transposase n=1 Tax=Vibrio sp. B1REV9 TaxID=2751179 RepID=UPI001BA7C512